MTNRYGFLIVVFSMLVGGAYAAEQESAYSERRIQRAPLITQINPEQMRDRSIQEDLTKVLELRPNADMSPLEAKLLSEVSQKALLFRNALAYHNALQAHIDLGRAQLAENPNNLEFAEQMRDWEDKLSCIEEDTQLANIDLQNALQKQQQVLQMMSNISKSAHDILMSVIRKIGG